VSSRPEGDSSPGGEERIEAAADELESANRELLAFLASLEGEQWAAVTTDERWPVRGAAYHVADGYRIHIRWLEFLRVGKAVPGLPADLDAENARAVADAADLSPEVIAAAADTAGRLLVAYVRGLRGEELSRSAPHGQLGGRRVAVSDMLDISPWHVRTHLAGMRRAVGR
jgi:DinB superfamily